jgi:pimeloyl-ACP methyl ester carboxylesterase
MFPNYEYIKGLNCKVFIVHGEQDGIVPWIHAEELSK